MDLKKNTYTKAEILEVLGVQSYIMALWEKQFSIQTTLIDNKCFYSAQDLAKLISIKELLYEKGYTIDAAKQYLQANPQLLEISIIAASPLLFESKKDPIKMTPALRAQLDGLQQQLIKFKQLLEHQ